jgi:hypothetical protein
MAEVIANSNSQILLAVSAAAFSNLTPNGATFRITAQGFPVLGQFGSMTYNPSAQFNIYAGANGTSADPLVQTIILPPAVSGTIFLDTFVTLKANAKAAGGLSPNVVFTSSTSNANINSALSATNTATISVYALAGSGQNAAIVYQSSIVAANNP